MVEVTGLHTKITADISDFDRKLNLVSQRLTGMSSSMASASSRFNKYTRIVSISKASTDQLNKSVMTAAAVQRQMALSVQASTIHLGTNSARAKTTATQMNKAAIQAGNLGAQFNDIGVMLAAGQSPLMLAVQQGTQINQVMDQMGGTAREKLASLGAAAVKLINPFSLLTLGVIAGGAALIQWGVKAAKASEDGSELAEKLEKMRENMASVSEELRAMDLGVSKEELPLVDAITEAEAKLLKLKHEQNIAGNIQAAQMENYITNQQTYIEKLKDELAQHRENISEIERRNNEEAELESLLNNAAAAISKVHEEQRQAAIAAREHKQAVREAAREFIYLNAHARRFAGEAEVMSQAVGRSAEEIREAEIRAEELAKEIGEAGVLALRLAGIDLASNIDAGTMAAARLAGQLSIALDRAIAIGQQSAMDAATGGAFSRDGPGQSPSDPGASRGPSTMTPNNVSKLPGQGKTGGRGGGGGGTSQAEQMREKLLADVEALRVALLTQEELERESYERRQLMLQEFLAAHPEKTAEAHEMMERLNRQHQERMAEIDVYRYGTTLQKTGQFMGDMANALAQGGSEMVKISKVFGAAQALIATWTGAAEALKLGFPQNLAAFAQVLGTGLGAVQAIRGVSTSGSSAGSTGGIAATSGGIGQTQPQAPAQQRQLTLVGDRFNRQQAIAIAEFMNDGTDDGLVIRGRK